MQKATFLSATGANAALCRAQTLQSAQLAKHLISIWYANYREQATFAAMKQQRFQQNPSKSNMPFSGTELMHTSKAIIEQELCSPAVVQDDPDAEHFDVFKVIGEVYQHIRASVVRK